MSVTGGLRYPPFDPFFRNPHLATIAGNFWSRPAALDRYPLHESYFEPEPGIKILVHEQRPTGAPLGELILLHGLEGSSHAGYIQSLAYDALEAGFGVHRLNMRSCGGTETVCQTLYHAGLTSDTQTYLQRLRDAGRGPLYLTGFSLGGNVALKLAGELGEAAADLLAGVAAISTPIDLHRCVDTLGRPENRIYSWRFLTRLKERIRRKSLQCPGEYPVERLPEVDSVYAFDDLFTAPAFGFGDAANYYATQSSQRFLPGIRIPTVLVAAQDDPLIPFSVYQQPAIAANPHVTLVAPEHGGHLGFLSRRRPRFWVDGLLLTWFATLQRAGQTVRPKRQTSP